MKEMPAWVEAEINSIKDESFVLEDSWEGTGYFLDIDRSNRLVDINFYEKLPIGKYIITARVKSSIDIDNLRKGIVYTYKINVLKAGLSDRLSKFLKENFNIDMNAVYRFELESLEPLEDVISESIAEEEG